MKAVENVQEGPKGPALECVKRIFMLSSSEGAKNRVCTKRQKVTPRLGLPADKKRVLAPFGYCFTLLLAWGGILLNRMFRGYLVPFTLLLASAGLVKSGPFWPFVLLYPAF